MSIGSFSTGLSGLTANAAALKVIGNNLANITTIGFKSSSVTFQDLVSQTVGGASVNPMQVGLGVTTGAISLSPGGKAVVGRLVRLSSTGTSPITAASSFLAKVILVR